MLRLFFVCSLALAMIGVVAMTALADKQTTRKATNARKPPAPPKASGPVVGPITALPKSLTGPNPPGPVVTPLGPKAIHLQILMAAGNVDLQHNDHVIVYALVGNSATKYSVDMNNGAKWPRLTSLSGTLQLPAGTNFSDIQVIGVHFRQTNMFAPPDNWSMSAIQVYGFGSTFTTLVSQLGNPLWRVQGANPRDWTIKLH